VTEWDRQRQRGPEEQEADVDAPSAEEQAHELRLRVARHKRMVQRKAARDGAGRAVIPQTTGSPLPAAARERMEPQLGADLSAVRVHTGSESAAAAEKLGARAFTTGTDVHFGAGEFAPGTREGDRLIAHELTHAVQAGSAGIQRKANPEEHAGDEEEAHDVSHPDDPAEKEADAAGDHAAAQLHGGSSGAAAGQRAPVAQQAPGVGRKIHLARKNNGKKDNDQSQQEQQPPPRLGTPGQHQPAPKQLPAFPNAQRVPPKTPVQGGGGMRKRWKDPDGNIYEWDSQHGAVEKYNSRGVHLGEFDPNTGAQTKPADKTRKVDP
jgi:putative cytotoxic protein/uncharacterized protein DUF4157